jgi:hypothetical protein
VVVVVVVVVLVVVVVEEDLAVVVTLAAAKREARVVALAEEEAVVAPVVDDLRLRSVLRLAQDSRRMFVCPSGPQLRRTLNEPKPKRKRRERISICFCKSFTSERTRSGPTQVVRPHGKYSQNYCS